MERKWKEHFKLQVTQEGRAGPQPLLANYLRFMYDRGTYFWYGKKDPMCQTILVKPSQSLLPSDDLVLHLLFTPFPANQWISAKHRWWSTCRHTRYPLQSAYARYRISESIGFGISSHSRSNPYSSFSSNSRSVSLYSLYQWVHQHIYDLHPCFHLQEQKELSLQRKPRRSPCSPRHPLPPKTSSAWL